MKSLRIAIVISSLEFGGAERVATNLANGLVARGHDVMVSTYRDDRKDFYPLDPRVVRVRFQLEGNGFDKLHALKACLEPFHPDLVISNIDKTNVRSLLAGWRSPWKTVVVEHNDPRMKPIEWNWNWARQLLYRQAYRLVVVSQGLLNRFPLVPSSRKITIHNGVFNPGIRHDGTIKKRFVAMGRLVPQKGFDLLIEAFRRIEGEVSPWSLDIWGEGPERNALQNQIDRLGLTERIRLRGLTDTPFDAIAQGDIFVSSSRFEGFGNVLAEAMTVGLPVISFDCPTGPRDIVEENRNGILVPNGDCEILGRAMSDLARDSELRQRLARGALLTSKQFRNDVIIDRWETMLEKVVS